MKRSGPRFLAIASVVLLLLSALSFAAPNPAGAADAGSITVRLHGCDNGFDGIDATVAQLAQHCQFALGGVDFTVQFASVAPSHQTDIDGSWEFTDIPAGQVILSEFPTDPSYLIRATCSQFDAASGPSGATEEPAGQGSVTFNLLAGQAIDCDWYNFVATAPVPTPTAGGSLISTRAHLCPTSYSGLQVSIYDLAQSCQGAGSGQEITFSHDDTLLLDTTTDGGGNAEYNGFAQGEAEIDQHAQAGVTVRAFCEVYDDSGNSTTGFKEYADAVVQLLHTGDNFQCDFFFITTNPVGTGTVYLNKHNCPAGFDAASANIYSLAQHCNAPGTSGVNFSLLDARTNGNGQPIAMTTDANGLITWTNVVGGPLTIAETFPSGYFTARAFCNNKKLTGDETGETEVPVSAGSMSGNFIGGYDFFYCDWFDIPAGSANNAASSPVVTNGTPVSGGATPVVIVVTPTGGNGSSQQNGGNGSNQQNGGNGGNGAVNPTPIITSGVGSLTLDVFTCPKGYNGFAASANPVNDCANPAAGVQYALKSNTGASTKQATGADGRTLFSNLAAGSYQLTETLPAGVTSAFVWSCVSNARNFADYPFLPFARVGTSGLIGISLQPGENLECSWYNVPSKSSTATTTTAAAGTIVKITLLACPGQSVTLSTCQPAANGVGFTFTPTGGGAAVSVKTDNNGIATTTVPAGTYALAEDGAVWCLADSTAFDQNAHLVIGATPVDVSIYNCGA